MILAPQGIVSGHNLAGRSLEVEFGVVLSRAIASIENDPVQLRSLVYELARIRVEREPWNLSTNDLEARRVALALESAIKCVETVYSRHDAPSAPQSLDRPIESSEMRGDYATIERREPLLAIKTADADHLLVYSARAKGMSLKFNHRRNGRVPRRCCEEEWSPFLPWRCAR